METTVIVTNVDEHHKHRTCTSTTLVRAHTCHSLALLNSHYQQQFEVLEELLPWYEMHLAGQHSEFDTPSR